MSQYPTKILLAACLIAVSGLATAATPSALDSCVSASLAKHPGKIVSLASETEDGKTQFELDIKGNDGLNWEVECNALTGKINRVEREINPASKEFKSKAKIRLDAAIKIALDKYPGQVRNIEYDLEDDGEVSYEFIIDLADGKQIEVEVDAASGKLAGYETMGYRIGH
jgi:uncharacterized membrane protein YkoI